jgi:hypothetical protein
MNRIKRIGPLFLAVLAVSTGSLAAESLADLRGTLSKLQSDAPVRARIEIKLTESSKGDESTRQTAKDAVVTAESGPQGMRLSWPAQALAEARKAARQRAANPEASKQDGGLAELNAEDVVDLLSFAEPLSLLIEGAALVEEKNDVRQGRPARLLVLQPRERMSASEKKMLKSREDTVRVWLDPEGFPLAMERALDLKFSKFLISFAATSRESRTFARVGGRLVVTYESVDGGGSGLGQSGQSKRQTRVIVLP